MANIIALNAIIVVGLNLPIGYAGQISPGHAAFYGPGAYFSAILTVTFNMSPWTAMIVAACMTAVLAAGISIPSLKLHGHYPVMSTPGFNVIVNIILLQWDKATGGPSGFSGIPCLKVNNWAFDTDLKMYYLTSFSVCTSIVLALNLVNSRAGRGLRALQGSEIAAASLGVRTNYYKVKVFVLSAVIASVAGCLYGHYLAFVSPKTFDIFVSVELVTMVVAGGMGSIWGGLSGTVLLTSLPSLLHVFDEYRDICYGLVLVVMLVFLPEGPVFDLLTVEENLEMGAYLRGRHMTALKLRNEMEQIVELFPALKPRLRQRAGTLSGGEQQMVAMSRGLMTDPKLLLLDEPSLGLAPLVVREIFRIIKQLQQDGRTILLVEQNAVGALAISNKAYVLETGRLTISGTAEAVRHDPEVRRAFPGRDVASG